MIFVLGIDLGKDGGLVLVDSEANIQLKMAMPVHPVDGGIDHYEVEAFLAKAKAIVRESDIKVIIEKVHAIAGNSAKSMNSFGENNGYVKGLVHIWFGRKIQEVTPRTWQKWLFGYCDIEEQEKKVNGKVKRDTKAMARQAVTKLYPKEDFRRNTRSKVPHSGIVDAIGVALYGLHSK